MISILSKHWGKILFALLLTYLLIGLPYTQSSFRQAEVRPGVETTQTFGYPFTAQVVVEVLVPAVTGYKTEIVHSHYNRLNVLLNVLVAVVLALIVSALAERYLTPFFHRLTSPKYFYHTTGRWLPYLWVLVVLLLAYGLLGGLYLSPKDYQQGDSFRIIFIHVPSAWMSMFVYVLMAQAAFVSIVWRIKMADVVLISSAPIGATFAFLALVTGSLWGKPMWGTWWIWDARLTSELILLFLYLGIIGLYSAHDDKRTASRAVAVLTLVGVVNIPIIHYSVEWWSTLHQGSTITKLDTPSIDLSMLIPLLVMALAFKLYYVALVIVRARTELLLRENNTRWVEAVLEPST